MTGYRSALETPVAGHQAVASAPRWTNVPAVFLTMVAGFWIVAGVALMALAALAPRRFG